MGAPFTAAQWEAADGARLHFLGPAAWLGAAAGSQRVGGGVDGFVVGGEDGCYLVGEGKNCEVNHVSASPVLRLPIFVLPASAFWLHAWMPDLVWHSRMR